MRARRECAHGLPDGYTNGKKFVPAHSSASQRE